MQLIVRYYVAEAEKPNRIGISAIEFLADAENAAQSIGILHSQRDIVPLHVRVLAVSMYPRHRSTVYSVRRDSDVRYRRIHSHALITQIMDTVILNCYVVGAVVNKYTVRIGTNSLSRDVPVLNDNVRTAHIESLAHRTVPIINDRIRRRA